MKFYKLLLVLNELLAGGSGTSECAQHFINLQMKLSLREKLNILVEIRAGERRNLLCSEIKTLLTTLHVATHLEKLCSKCFTSH